MSHVRREPSPLSPRSIVHFPDIRPADFTVYPATDHFSRLLIFFFACIGVEWSSVSPIIVAQRQLRGLQLLTCTLACPLCIPSSMHPSPYVPPAGPLPRDASALPPGSEKPSRFLLKLQSVPTDYLSRPLDEWEKPKPKIWLNRSCFFSTATLKEPHTLSRILDQPVSRSSLRAAYLYQGLLRRDVGSVQGARYWPSRQYHRGSGM